MPERGRIDAAIAGGLEVRGYGILEAIARLHFTHMRRHGCCDRDEEKRVVEEPFGDRARALGEFSDLEIDAAGKPFQVRLLITRVSNSAA